MPGITPLTPEQVTEQFACISAFWPMGHPPWSQEPGLTALVVTLATT